MTVLFIVLACAILFIFAYKIYGTWLAKNIFKLNSTRQTPAIELEDGQDYVPSSKWVVFGHHFTSIAGTGPIVGPALAVIWGWLPALLWVMFGSIFIGALQDFSSLVISLRNKGQTLGEIAGRLIGVRAKNCFLFILLFAITIVLAIFGLVIAAIFRQFPQAIIPCLIQIPLAIGVGVLIKQGKVRLFIPAFISLMIMLSMVFLAKIPWIEAANLWLSSQSTLWWVIALLVYCWIASIMPVWVLLQPRDFINALQLGVILLLMVVGLVVVSFTGLDINNSGVTHSLSLAAPMIEPNADLKMLPAILPFLFITIACGAVSGFHCLVASGTSSKQLRCETDAQFIGYGSMLMEGFLAVLVIMACCAGLGLGIFTQDDGWVFGQEAWSHRYGDWLSAKGLAAKVSAFVDGSSNWFLSLGLPIEACRALMGVFVASFAATTLDSACRLQRYVIQEIGQINWRKENSLTQNNLKEPKPLRLTWLTNKYVATTIAVSFAFVLACLRAKPELPMGTGGLILWPLFGAINQLLGGLAFIVVLVWLKKRDVLQGWRKLLIIIPAVFMLILPAWAMIQQIFFNALGSDLSWIEQKNWLLVIIGLSSLLLEIVILVEAYKTLFKRRILIA